MTYIPDRTATHGHPGEPLTVSVGREGNVFTLHTPKPWVSDRALQIKEAVRRLPSRRFIREGDGGYWTVPATPAVARRVLEEIAPLAALRDPTGELRRAVEQAERQIAAMRHKSREDLPEIPGRYCACPEGPQPGRLEDEENPLICKRCDTAIASMMHQRQAFHFARELESSMLHMDMGTGKSKVFVALTEDWDADIAIILCPTKVRRVWPREFKAHSVRDWVVAVGGGKDKKGRERKRPTIRRRIDHATDRLNQAHMSGRPFALVINYEAAWREPAKGWIVELMKRAQRSGRKVVVAFDESHKIKSPKGRWSRYAASLRPHADHAVGMTGTLMPHSPPDVYGQFRALDPGIFGTSYRNYLTRYFRMGGFEDRKVEGWADTDRMREHAEQIARITYICGEEVLDLPPWEDLPTQTCELGGESAKAYADMERDFVAWVQTDGQGAEPVNAANAMARLIRLAQITNGFLPVRDPDGNSHPVSIGTEKQDLLRDTIEDIIGQADGKEEPIVVFGRFKQDLARIRAVAEELGLRYGEISGRTADALNDDARMHDWVQVCGVQLQAGGVGIDLTRARYAIYYSMDFNLGDFKQSRKRVHRPGQTRPTFYIYLAGTGTVDETIAEALRRRENVVEACTRAAREVGTLELVA